jgi:hypothetical protein
MNITVVTHTAGNRPESLARCVESVDKQLALGDRHLVIQCNANFNETRWDSLKVGGWMCWVDDDDYVQNDAIAKCKTALELTGAGCAFTNESISDSQVCRDPRFWSEVTRSSGAIHHLCVFNTALVNPAVWDHFVEAGAGLEWLIKGYVALKHGAVHVQVDGYRWTQHPDQHSKSADWKRDYLKAQPILEKRLKEYAVGRANGMIPRHAGN